MDKPNLFYNTIGNENVELQGLCCSVLLASKKRESKSNANHVSKTKVIFFVPQKKWCLILQNGSKMLKYGNRNPATVENVFQEPWFTLGTVYHD